MIKAHATQAGPLIAVTKDRPSSGNAAREARLAAALRDNLKRRKAQARSLHEPDPDAPQGKVLSGPAFRRPEAGKP